MDVKEAVRLAKAHVTDLFGPEGITNLGLEEVEYDDTREQWRITLGFSRPWNQRLLTTGMERVYKFIVLNKEGKPLSVKNRETANAG